MENQFGHGFVTTLILIAQHFALPPEQAWHGVQDHVTGLELPEKYRGTEIEEITTLLRKKVIWHQAGTRDREDAGEVISTLHRLVVAIDADLGIRDPRFGRFG